MSVNDEGYKIALEEAEKGLAEGGIPVGSCVVGADGKILGRGRNTRMQNGSPILHAETAAFDDDRNLPISAFEGSTLYTTMSPCPMCTGACIWFKIKRLVIGDNVNFKGPEHLSREHGIEVVVLNTEEYINLTVKSKQAKAEMWKAEIP